MPPATPLTACQLRLCDLIQQARQLSQLLATAELDPLGQARLLVRLDKLAGKLESLTEQVADAVADVPQRR